MLYLVNVKETQITPVVVEAVDEWDAMNKAKDGDGYIHESGSFHTLHDPTSWDVSEFSPRPLWEEWR